MGLFSLFFFSCEKNSDNVIDPNYISPFVSNLNKSADTIYTNSFNPVISFISTVQANSNGGSNIKNVYCKIYSPDNSLLVTFEMLDNGILPDSILGDGHYSANINISGIQCLQIGQYKISISAVNADGLNSNQITSFFNVINPTNQSPVIYRLDVPDSVVRPISGQINLTLNAYAKDTNGVCDIDMIYFDAYRPSGIFIGRYPMTYNSAGIYSYTNIVNPATSDSSYGYFKYFFQAVDKSGALSTYAKDSINFVRPLTK